VLDAYYQCFRQRQAFKEVIKRFRLLYGPGSSKVIVVNDGGYDFTDLATEFNCEYYHEENITQNKNLIFSGAEGLFQYACRLAKHCQEFENKYFILLEDDVITIKHVDIDTLKRQINGCNNNEFLDPAVSKEIRRHNPALAKCAKIWYGACGGSIFETQFMVNLLKDKDRLRTEAHWYCSHSRRKRWASDCFLSYLCLKSGGSIGQYPGYCETWYADYGDRMVEGSVEVLHQYKRLYD
jgi:hypothetical protein